LCRSHIGLYFPLEWIAKVFMYACRVRRASNVPIAKKINSLHKLFTIRTNIGPLLLESISRNVKNGNRRLKIVMRKVEKGKVADGPSTDQRVFESPGKTGAEDGQGRWAQILATTAVIPSFLSENALSLTFEALQGRRGEAPAGTGVEYVGRYRGERCRDTPPKAAMVC
jgi:hypothetical protein